MSSVEMSRTRVGTPRVCTFWNTEGVHFGAFHYYCIGGKGSRKYVPNIF